ncbi:MAG: hypothetical protein UU67_C0040G0007 [Candidatus Daviesbacteria bacterium GW2011_GWB1_41_5]|uniref:Uncharacterized protein n=1 Tax=Candidatus Daviesbacteria bacterium GW2011_GWB1_41_5 TaxID=1618429 RepID=A0A0G0ZIJ7_9BACT|nr:MAG: hypothetical protein UU67_C0040G0007 [Candidatus Daviesbacteria bacterium GW2011_GWB1_41_5]
MPHDQRCTQAMSTRMGITSTLLYESVEFRGKGICLPLVPKKRMTLREGQESLAFLLESIMEDLHRKRAEWIGIQDKARAQYLEGAVQTHTDAPETIHAVVDNLVSVAREDPRYANSPIIVLGQTKGRKRAETQTVFPLLTNVDLWAIDDAVIIGLRASNLPSTPSWSFSKTAADPWGKLEIGSEHEGFSVVLRGSPLQLRRWGEEELEETDVAERKFSEFLVDGEDGYEPGFWGDRDNSYALLYYNSVRKDM